MKQWFALTCPTCGFRYPITKFTRDARPILYPIQLVTGGGRARGFTVLKYLPWSQLPDLRGTEVWEGLLCLYDRLSAAYDRFYQVLGFLSPEIKMLLQELRKSYADSYLREPFAEYAPSYIQANAPPNIVGPYSPGTDYPKAYDILLNPHPVGGADYD